MHPLLADSKLCCHVPNGEIVFCVHVRMIHLTSGNDKCRVIGGGNEK
jgi:hypothetical protein